MAASSRSRPEAPHTTPANRHSPLFREPVSENSANRGGNARGIDIRRSNPITVPPAHDQSLRRASPTRTGLWEFSARRSRDESDVAGKSGLRPLYERNLSH